MIKDFDLNQESQLANEKLSDLGNELARYQRKLLDAKIPVMIIIEGWESSGHEYVINDLIHELNPRHYHVKEFSIQDSIDRSKPFLWRYWQLLPKKGDMAILDRSYYFNLFNSLDEKKAKLNEALRVVENFERNQTDDHMIFLKFFLHVDKKTHRQRLDVLKNDKNRSFFFTDIDRQQYDDYKDYRTNIDKILTATNFEYAPWHVINAMDIKDAAREVIAQTTTIIADKLNQLEKESEIGFYRDEFDGPLPLDTIDLSLKVEDEVYDEELDKLQKEVSLLTYRIFNRKVPTIILFEGMDAAGKGGAIERLTRNMDARFYDVVPISAPTETELQYHYLWRFYKEFPTRGHTTIFDRSWYGRVLVERIEGFATTQEWERAYDEINQMEKELIEGKALLLKFFIYIDKDEQFQRFKDRENDLDKVYKITDEDWRNREKWDAYLVAMNEMLVRTSTDYAPWIIVEGNDKKFARLKVLREFIKAAKDFLSK